jgi:hypothetical protein
MPLALRGVECVGHLNRDFDEQPGIHRLAADAMLEGLALQEFHGDERSLVGFFNFVNGADVGMIQGRSRASFSLKAFKSLWVTG